MHLFTVRLCRAEVDSSKWTVLLYRLSAVFIIESFVHGALQQ